ncbi:two-component system, OmpR family, phosphate regulon response regulator PhoB [Mariprofundus micogutta]|uniref:Two-component system, OmpR family, phosphate regulon response regulator PhoB n=1 Tax=Mariprofundus micogutta TaxID=1921010 RepID=A0A1L8CKU5_9PROT|nr:winged helix-turn-helix domain-containing protein [Mariprofundus micogutta]GAV19489.1 two-component system, OmpR family, phosphate regulon response regulator PhoB [Mariprofundus micogutta]
MLEVNRRYSQYQALMKGDKESQMDNADILIIEDEAPIARLIALHLHAAGYSTYICEDGDAALAALRDSDWKLLVLDRMLPGTSGMKILRWVKSSSAHVHIPVLMVTALGMSSERVQGLNDGADDYLPKPFEPDELVARANALLRRSRVVETGTTDFSCIELDPDVPVVFEGDKRVELRPLEYKLLKILMHKPGKTRDREYLLDHVWGRDVFVEARTVDVTVKRLRKAMKELGRESCIETVRSMGYRFVSPKE